MRRRNSQTGANGDIPRGVCTTDELGHVKKSCPMHFMKYYRRAFEALTRRGGVGAEAERIRLARFILKAMSEIQAANKGEVI